MTTATSAATAQRRGNERMRNRPLDRWGRCDPARMAAGARRPADVRLRRTGTLHQRVLTRQGQSTQIGCVKYAATGEAAGEPAVLLPSMRCGRASLLTPDHPPKGLARLAPLAS